MTAWRITSAAIGLAFLTGSAMAAGEEGSELARIQVLVGKARITMAQAVEIAAKEVDRAYAGHYPTVDLNATYNYNRNPAST